MTSAGLQTRAQAWCRANTIKPVMALQAHSAPLGIAFYNASKPRDPKCPPTGAFPRRMDGDAFIAYHGSWDREPARRPSRPPL